MKNDMKWLVIALLLIVLIIGAAVLYTKLSDGYDIGGITEETDGKYETGGTDSGESEKMMAPDFTVYDADGEEVKLSDYIGRPIVLNFWASWCSPCKSEMPVLEAAYKENTDVVFMMVNLTGGRETLESAKAFLADSGYTFPVYFDTELSAASAYYATSIPLTYFINGKGEIIANYLGPVTENIMKQGIELIKE